MKLSLKDIAEMTQCRLVGDANHVITHIADLATATGSDAAFFATPHYEKRVKYGKAMEASNAGVIFIESDELVIEGRNFLIGEEPSRSFQVLIDTLLEEKGPRTGFPGVHPSAVVHDDAALADGVTVGPNAVIDKGVTVASNTVIGAQCHIGAGVTIGEDCLLHPQVTIREHCHIGNRVILQPGAVIGSCGFGYLTDKYGKHTKLQQAGNVILEDDVEIGANSCVDRARFKSTRIGKGTKIDNLVQIAHGVELGEDNILVSLVAIAGSAKTGKRVVMAGQSAMTGHITVCDDVICAGRTGITKSIKEPGQYSGKPATPIKQHQKQEAHQRRLEKYVKRITELEKRISAFEKEHMAS
jgi:UDP-3-O-[3-hydroxymyristoyl] glucosamine N-acyltransferase